MLKSIFAGIGIFLAGLFGSPHLQPVVPLHDQPAAASVALFPVEGVPPSLASTTQGSPVTNATTTVVNNYITKPVVERIIERPMLSASSGVTNSELDTRLQELTGNFSTQLAGIAAANAAAPNNFVTVPVFAQAGRIDNLANVSISNATVHGVSGLTASEIPSLSYLPLSGGTIAGDLTVSGAFSGGSLSLSVASTSNLVATNATSTNLFATTASSTNLFAQTASLGALTANTLALTSALPVSSGGTGWSAIKFGYIPFGNGSSAVATSTSLFWDNTNGRLGIGTNSPGAQIDSETRTRANGEQYYSPSGENIYAQSNPVIDSSSTGMGTDFTPSNVYIALKITTSADVTFLQALDLRIRQTGSLTNTSHINVALYTDSGGAPGVAIASGGQIFAGSVTTSYQTLGVVMQNSNSNLSPNTTYWVVITRSESGGNFIFDSTTGTGSTFQGVALNSLSEANVLMWYQVEARSDYGIHAYAPDSHAIWGVSVNAVGVRGDSTSHYGGFFNSNWGAGARGVSTYSTGLIGTSVNGDGVDGSTPGTSAYGVYGNNTAASGGYPGVYGLSTSGPGVEASTGVSTGGAMGLRSFQGIEFGNSKASQGNVLMSATAGVPTGYTTALSNIFFETSGNPGGPLVYVNTTAGTPGIFGTVNIQSTSADQGDTAQNIDYFSVANTVVWNTPLTANRAVVMQNTNIASSDGAKKRIVRTINATGAFNLTVSGLQGGATYALTDAGQYVDVEYMRSIGGWVVSAAGQLGGPTRGGVNFSDSAGSSTKTDSNFYWDNTNKRLGIGTNSPYALLSVSNSASTAANTPLFVIASTTGGTATTTVLSIASTGNVTITGSAATCTLGNGASATNCSSSDQRLKDNITTIDASSSLSAIESLRPVSFKWNAWMVGNGAATSTQFGFIAQEIMNTFPNLVTLDSNTHYYKLDYQGLFAPIVGAVQALAQKVADFSDSFTTKELTFTRANGDELTVHTLCLDDVCVTKSQLQAMLANAAPSGSSGSGSGSSGASGTGDASSTPDTTPPVITINGENPAHIHVGDSYADLGASVTDNVDKNLDLKYFLNGALVRNIVINTSAAATDTIDYVAADNAGNTATSTRIVMISPAVQADTSSTTAQ